jgi:hypothetical protein
VAAAEELDEAMNDCGRRPGLARDTRWHFLSSRASSGFVSEVRSCPLAVDAVNATGIDPCSR